MTLAVKNAGQRGPDCMTPTCRYTPLLPAVATGTIEERSIVEPIRKIIKDKGHFFEAVCEQILPEEQVW